MTRHVDLFAALAALVWAVLAQYLPEIDAVVSGGAASAFSIAAMTRWKKRMNHGDGGDDPKSADK